VLWSDLGAQTLLSSQGPVFSVQTSNPDNGLKLLILLSLPHIMHVTLNLSRSISLTAFPSLLPFPYPQFNYLFTILFF
jgi:hypothetical protein